MCKYRCRMGRHAWLLALGVLLALHAAAADPLRVEISNNQSAGATLFLAVYHASAGGWDQDPHRVQQQVLPQENPAAFSLALPPGRYAMRGFVDLNDNGVLDRGRRKPLEPFAISPGDDRDKPSVRFSQSLFTVDDTGRLLVLELIYPAASSNKRE